MDDSSEFSEPKPSTSSAHRLEVNPAEVRALANKWLDLRERLNDARFAALPAADFVSPGNDPVSDQITIRLQEAVDNGDGSLRSVLGEAMERIRVIADSLTGTADLYEQVDQAVERRIGRTDETL